MSIAFPGPLIEEISTTTGTGDYILAGASTVARFPFSSWYSNGQQIACQIEDGLGGFEEGIYTYNSGPNSLTRTLIDWSSNSGSAVNWAAGTRTIRSAVTAINGGLTAQAHNFFASIPPVQTDAAASGYGPFSHWLKSATGYSNRDGRIFLCTLASNTDAAWQEMLTDYKLRVREGSNLNMGAAALTAGSATVNTTQVTANSRIFLTSQADGGTPGWVRVSARVAGTSFTITSSSGSDTSTIGWLLVEPSA